MNRGKGTDGRGELNTRERVVAFKGDDTAQQENAVEEGARIWAKG